MIDKKEPGQVALQLAQLAQQELLASIFSPFEPELLSATKVQGLRIYRRNLHAICHRSLTITFPTLCELIGETLSYTLSLRFLRAHPNRLGDWGQWGRDFPQWLEEQAELAEYAYLGDIARLDHGLHEIQKAGDNTVDRASLLLLSEQEPAKLQVHLNKSLVLISSPYPVFDIWMAHCNNEDRENWLAKAKDKLVKARAGLFEQQYLIISRPLYKGKIKQLTQQEFRFLQQLKHNNNIAQALAQTEQTSFSFEAWLSDALKDNLLSHITLIQSE